MHEILKQLEAQMRQQFEMVRAKFAQSGNKGVSAEIILRDFLRLYLPRRYEFGHGEIIDSAGHRSAQTDLVIVTDQHPFTFTSDQPGVFFIEGVFAVGEVKSVLTSQELENAIANANRLDPLKAEAAGMKILWTTNESDNKRFTARLPCFLFAFETQLSKKAIVERLSQQPSRSLDAVFILDSGAILDLGDGRGLIRIHKTDDQAQIPFAGWVDFENFNSLGVLLLWLSVLPDVQYGGSIMSKYILNGLVPWKINTTNIPSKF